MENGFLSERRLPPGLLSVLVFGLVPPERKSQRSNGSNYCQNGCGKIEQIHGNLLYPALSMPAALHAGGCNGPDSLRRLERFRSDCTIDPARHMFDRISSPTAACPSAAP